MTMDAQRIAISKSLSRQKLWAFSQEKNPGLHVVVLSVKRIATQLNNARLTNIKIATTPYEIFADDMLLGVFSLYKTANFKTPEPLKHVLNSVLIDRDGKNDLIESNKKLIKCFKELEV